MFDLDATPKSLLTVGNPKTAKGEKLGYLTAILHFAPHKLSGRNVCSHASAGCIAACLNTAGRGGIGLDENGLNAIQVARIRRTRLFSSDQNTFMARWILETRQHELRAAENGLKAAERPNGTSDIPWENVKVTPASIALVRKLAPRHMRAWANSLNDAGYPNIFAIFPDVTFYDYTKMPARLRRNVARVPNYSLTFSLSETNDAYAREALASGINVAVAFDVKKGAPLPASFMNYPVIDGDLSDLRFTDASPAIVGLRAKGSRGKSDTSGFVRSAN